MRLMRFNVKAKYVPGKDMLVADTLSRSPVSTTKSNSHEEIHAHVSDVQSSWQVSDAGLAKIRAETLKDVNLKAAMEYTIHGWPQYKDVQLAARDFFIIRGELSLHDGLLVREDRIVVPFSLRKQIVERIHEGHMGMAKFRERAAQSVWWPRIGKDIKSRVASCRHCLKKQPSQASEPLLPSALPETLSEGRHWHLWVPKQAIPGAGGLLLKVYWRHIPAQLGISNGDREIKELFLPSWRSRDSCFRQRYPVLLGRVLYFCRSVELQPCHQHPPLSAKQ